MTNNVVLTPITYHMRIYDHSITDKEVLDEYKTIATVYINGDIACISGMLGNLSKNDYVNISIKLSELHVKRVIWETHKNGKIIQKEVLVSTVLK